ncbi:MAG: spore germination protein [Clostridiales bacterium]|nr:spore germination protein [Clostridiales bacterium]
MSLFGAEAGHVAHHPRREPEFDGPLTWERVEAVFADCEDFSHKEVRPPHWETSIRVCWLGGMVRSERLNDYVLRPLGTLDIPQGERPTRALLDGGVWNQDAREQTTVDDTVAQLLEGSCALFLLDGVITCSVETEEKRSVSEPENETEMKGARDSFVESVRTNTSLVRRRLRSPHLKIQRHVVGRQTRTPVELLWLEGLTDPALPARIARRLDEIDEDGLLTTAELEEYLTDPKATAFPRVLFTERPDRMCRGLLEGRVALLIDGLAVGALLPGDVSLFLKAPQDRSYHWLAATALRVLRYVCVVLTLLLPGFYIAVAEFHFELIPTSLALSIIASKQDVPFPTAFEVVGLLVAFEVLQEAGQRLPKTIGQTVSIIGGLVVGQAAVDAKIVSPVVVIVVAVAGVAGFTVPDQDFANALRLWRLLLALLAALAGLFGVTVGAALLIVHLAGLEDHGFPYLGPFGTPGRNALEGGPILRRPVPEDKLRPTGLNTENWRKRG